MRCPECELEMMRYGTGAEGDVYVCRNPRCGRFDRRLERPKEPDKAKKA